MLEAVEVKLTFAVCVLVITPDPLVVILPAVLMPPPEALLKLNVPATVIGPAVAPVPGILVDVVTLAVTFAGITKVEKLPVLSVEAGKLALAMLKLPPVAIGVDPVLTVSVCGEEY